MQYVVLTTGSCGNCYIFHNNGETIIVDDGVTFTKLSTELERHEIPLSSVKAMFLTHLHPDHSKGVGVFMRKTHLPVYISKKSQECCRVEMDKQKIDWKEVNTFEHGEELNIGSFSITPFRTYHDSVGSSGYFIENNNKHVFLMTDTGIVPEEAFEYAREAELMFVESNYDLDMLDNGPYANWLKERVKGSYGHLSNTDAVDFASRTARQGDQVCFVHISENNNNTSIVKEMARVQIPSGIFVKVLERGEMTGGFIN